jgi:ABC-type transport system involved in multi-copper enzyme maturation permease subunit
MTSNLLIDFAKLYIEIVIGTNDPILASDNDYSPESKPKAGDGTQSELFIVSLVACTLVLIFVFMRKRMPPASRETS